MQLPRIVKSGYRCCIGQSPDRVLDSQDNTAIHMAAMAGELNAIRRLVRHAARINVTNKFGQTALHLAAMENHVTVVRFLIRAGADIGAADNDGRTPLHYASAGAAMEAVAVLISFGACPHRQDRAGQSAIFSLYRKFDFQDVQAMLNHNDQFVRIVEEVQQEEGEERLA